MLSQPYKCARALVYIAGRRTQPTAAVMFAFKSNSHLKASATDKKCKDARVRALRSNNSRRNSIYITHTHTVFIRSTLIEINSMCCELSPHIQPDIHHHRAYALNISIEYFQFHQKYSLRKTEKNLNVFVAYTHFCISMRSDRRWTLGCEA